MVSFCVSMGGRLGWRLIRWRGIDVPVIPDCMMPCSSRLWGCLGGLLFIEREGGEAVNDEGRVLALHSGEALPSPLLPGGPQHKHKMISNRSHHHMNDFIIQLLTRWARCFYSQSL